MEELRRQLDQLRVFMDYPRLVAENATLKEQLGTVTRELSSLQAVERVVGYVPLTLPQLRRRVLDIEADEIEQGAQRRYNAWSANERPHEVRAEALSELKRIIDTLRRPPPHYYTDDTINHRLPRTTEELLSNEVQSRLDQAFRERVDAEVQRRTATQLDAEKREAWPR